MVSAKLPPATSKIKLPPATCQQRFSGYAFYGPRPDLTLIYYYVLIYNKLLLHQYFISVDSEGLGSPWNPR